MADRKPRGKQLQMFGDSAWWWLLCTLPNYIQQTARKYISDPPWLAILEKLGEAAPMNLGPAGFRGHLAIAIYIHFYSVFFWVFFSFLRRPWRWGSDGLFVQRDPREWCRAEKGFWPCWSPGQWHDGFFQEASQNTKETKETKETKDL